MIGPVIEIDGDYLSRTRVIVMIEEEQLDPGSVAGENAEIHAFRT